MTDEQRVQAAGAGAEEEGPAGGLEAVSQGRQGGDGLRVHLRQLRLGSLKRARIVLS